MSVTYSSPGTLMQPVPYHHVAVGTGSRHIHVAGQIGSSSDGTLVATDLAGQVAQALRNVHTALRAVDSSFADVVRLTFSVADWTSDKMDTFMAGIADVAAEIDLPSPMPPASLIGVSILFEPDVLVEVDATAVTD